MGIALDIRAPENGSLLILAVPFSTFYAFVPFSTFYTFFCFYVLCCGLLRSVVLI